MRVFIEGMGWLGSLLANRLAYRSVPFYWTDNESINAWQASTGCVYPVLDGDEESDAYRTWSGLAQQPWVESVGLEPYVEQGTFTFNHKNAPHGSKLRVFPVTGATEFEGPLRKVIPPSVHVNVRAYVRDTRARFAASQWEGEPPEASAYVAAHGFRRAESYVWGWSAPVKLKLDERLQTSPRLCLYLRPHRYQVYYAYPVPGLEEWWWAGSDMLSQSVPKQQSLDYVAARAEAWRSKVIELTEGLVEPTLGAAEGFKQGWRPKRQGETTACHTDPTSGWIVAPALGPNGVRLAPPALRSLLRALLERGV